MSAFAVIYERIHTPLEPGVLERVMARLYHRQVEAYDDHIVGSQERERHVRYGVESLPTFEQNLEILQSAVTTFACTQSGDFGLRR